MFDEYVFFSHEQQAMMHELVDSGAKVIHWF
jgi:thymidine kinase